MKNIVFFAVLIVLLSIFSSCATSEQCPGVAKAEIIEHKA